MGLLACPAVPHGQAGFRCSALQKAYRTPAMLTFYWDVGPFYPTSSLISEKIASI